MTPVKSSTVAAYDYDPATQAMTVQYKSGGTYTYTGVPPKVHADFVAAGSKGSFLARHIRGRYDHTKER
jgi:hypothetical protein